MTNIDRAADIIWRQSDAAQGGDAAAQALAAAGLLAPDPVEPYAEGMTSGPRVISAGVSLPVTVLWEPGA